MCAKPQDYHWHHVHGFALQGHLEEGPPSLMLGMVWICINAGMWVSLGLLAMVEFTSFIASHPQQCMVVDKLFMSIVVVLKHFAAACNFGRAGLGPGHSCDGRHVCIALIVL